MEPTPVEISSDDATHEEIADIELLDLFLDRQAGENAAAGAGALGFRDGLEGFLEHVESFALAHRFESIGGGAGDHEGFADGAAALGDEGMESNSGRKPCPRDRGVAHPFLVEEKKVVGFRPAGYQASHDDGLGRGAAQGVIESFEVAGQGVGEAEDGGGIIGCSETGGEGSAFPVSAVDLGAGQLQEKEGETARVLDFLASTDQPGAGCADHPRGMTVDLENFDQFLDVRSIIGGHEGEDEVRRSLQLFEKTSGGLADQVGVEGAGQETGGGSIRSGRVHGEHAGTGLPTPGREGMPGPGEALRFLRWFTVEE